MKRPAELAYASSLVNDHPDSVRQLRRLIVALAITGRLTEERGGTGASNELLRQLDARHQQLVAEGKLSRIPALLPVAEADLPDVCPAGPLYLRLGDVAKIEKGRTGIASALPGPFPLVVTAQSRATCDHFDIEGAAAIVPLVSSSGHGKASLQRLHYQEGKFALGTILAAVIPNASDLLSARFIFEYLTSFKDELLVSQMIGTANVTLTIGKIANTPVPLVAGTVQRKVDELMALCDRLEAARAEREEARDRLTATSLARLNTPDAETFHEDARFALDALPALTTRADLIEQTRQTILGMAMAGKLVPQDSSDESASALLSRKVSLPIGYQRRRKILKESSVDAPEALFPVLPASWTYADVQSLYDLNVIVDYADGNHGALYPRSSEFGDEGTLFVTAKDLIDGRVAWSSSARLNESRARQLPKGWARGGDVLLTHNATVGRVARVERDAGPFLLGTSVTFYRLNPEALNPDFFYYFLQSPIWQGQLAAIMAQTTRNQVSIQKQAFFRVVVPPLAEQHRIVARVQDLMAVCDGLEASLSSSDELRRRLLDALLHEALERTEPMEEAA
jgi:type I restriction enzyme S subunit